jgi:hypothetical protein
MIQRQLRDFFPKLILPQYRAETFAAATPPLLDTGQPTWVSIAQFYEEEDSGSSRSSSRCAVFARIAVAIAVVALFHVWSRLGSAYFMSIFDNLMCTI